VNLVVNMIASTVARRFVTGVMSRTANRGHKARCTGSTPRKVRAASLVRWCHRPCRGVAGPCCRRVFARPCTECVRPCTERVWSPRRVCRGAMDWRNDLAQWCGAKTCRAGCVTVTRPSARRQLARCADRQRARGLQVDQHVIRRARAREFHHASRSAKFHNSLQCGYHCSDSRAQESSQILFRDFLIRLRKRPASFCGKLRFTRYYS